LSNQKSSTSIIEPQKDVRSKRNINLKLDKDFLYDKDIIDNYEQKMFIRTEDKKAGETEKVLEENPKPKLKKLEPKNIPLQKTSSNTKVSQKENIRQETLTAFTKILEKNEIFKKEGIDYINSLSKDLEKELFDDHSSVNHDYKKAFNNMCKTVKELENYKNVSCLIAQKKKLNITKVSKFPYGEKVID